ncbi:MAG: RagB/SusD family nutrient uptake outer membrane protein [Bacteroidales bacterium]|nr:RagB/SusD family nutrient uptake outer membrane protein [Bacteroidales bacterium]
MNKIYTAVLALLTLLSLTACEDFLDSTNKTKKDTSNYPETPEDADQLLTGVYSILGRMEPLCNTFFIGEVMSDNCFGGGDQADLSTKAIDQFKKSGEDMFRNGWRARYFGVYRSNFLLSVLDNIDWDSVEQRQYIEGQTRFMRAYYYFDLSLMFGEVPLVLTPEAVNIPRNPANETYAVIADDLKKAIEYIPAVRATDMPVADHGRITRWAAEALMARVFLFYTGYYRTETLPLPDGGEITKAQVVNWITDCVENSGHDLLDDFRNLWPYSYVQDYKYTADNNLSWAGDSNIEEVFAIKYSTLGTWDVTPQKCNQICLYYGMRGQPSYVLTFPFGQGWGFGTVNPVLWDQWDDADIRKKGSIINTQDRNEVRMYTKGGGNQMDETYFINKKHCPINVYTDATKTNVVGYSVPLYNMTETNFQLTNTQDCIVIRFADVLLMAAELGAPNAQSYFDRVRNRVGLNSLPVTLENIKSERRFELAFEGVRYYDLLRWHDERLIDENQHDVQVYDRRVPRKKTINFRPETRGFLPIPLTEIQLSEGVLTQNPGWEGSDNYVDGI